MLRAIAATVSLAAGASAQRLHSAGDHRCAAAQIATDRRTTGAQLDDELIEDKAIAAIADRLKSDMHVNVTSYNGIALLTGEVPAEAAKNDVAQTCGRCRRCERCRTSSSSARPARHPGPYQRHADHVKGKGPVRRGAKFQINHVKVVTERGVVYLMGIVRRDEGDAAAQTARTTSGVERVVKVFEYIS